MMSYLAMSLGDRFCMSGRGGTGGGGWVHLKGANYMAISRCGYEKPNWLEPGRPFLVF